MQGAMPRMSISTGQASAGGSGTSKELSNSIPLLGGYRDAAVRLRPAGRVVQEFLDLGELDRIELAAGLGEFQHVPPGAQVVQFDAEIAEDLLALRIDAVEEDDEDMLDDRAG